MIYRQRKLLFRKEKQKSLTSYKKRNELLIIRVKKANNDNSIFLI